MDARAHSWLKLSTNATCADGPDGEHHADGGQARIALVDQSCEASSANAYLVQRQADVLGVPVEIAPVAEATALGAAAMAGVGAGLLDLDQLAELAGGGRVVEPRNVERADADYREWRAFAELASRL